MTYCNTLMQPLLDRIEAGDSLDVIGKSFCGDTVKNPRAKALRLIKSLLGDAILREHADTLGYNSKKAVRIKSLSTDTEQRKIISKTQSDADVDSEYAFLLANLRKLVKKSSLEMVREALEQIEQEEQNVH